MNQREKDALDRHITGNYGEDQISNSDEMQVRDGPINAVDVNRDDSGRPPIDAPPTEHRRWFSNMLEKLIDQHSETIRIGGSLFASIDEPKLMRMERAMKQMKETGDALVQAYMDGNEAERKTLEFKANEFIVVDDGDYTVVIEEYANRGMADPPRYSLKVHHGLTPILKLRDLTTRAFDLDPSVARNINSEGP
jgi:hypothetical protein